MARRSSYSAEFKSKIVLEVITGERQLEEIASENNLNPNMVRTWKREFLAKAHTIFEKDSGDARELQKLKNEFEAQKGSMLKTIGQLKLERDFLEDSFRKVGKPVKLPGFDR